MAPIAESQRRPVRVWAASAECDFESERLHDAA